VLVVLLTIEVIHLSDGLSGFAVAVTVANGIVLGILLIFRKRFIEHQTGGV
jgi:hypothetical protein